MRRTNEKYLALVGFKGALPLFTYRKDGRAKSGYLGSVIGRFGALRGAPGVTDG